MAFSMPNQPVSGGATHITGHDFTKQQSNRSIATAMFEMKAKPAEQSFA